MTSCAALLLAALALPTAAAADPPRAQVSIDLPLTLGSGAIWAALYLGEDRQDLPDAYGEPPGGIDALAPTELNEGIAGVSDIVLYGTLGVTAVTAIADGWGDDPAGRFLLYAEAYALNGAITEVVKYAVRRPRPYTFGGEREGGSDDDKSFFSGHTSFVAVTSFTTARTVDLCNDLPVGARIALYGGATALTAGVGAMRVAAGKHFPSDVLVGALVGASIGWVVPELHRGRVSLGATRLPDGGLGVVVDGRW